MKICVYCASSAKIDKIYFDATERLAQEFVKANIDDIDNKMEEIAEKIHQAWARN